jgi:gas vesicle protein
MSDDHSHDGKFLFGFFIGGLIGALIIFFLGTKEGKKTGRMLERRGKDLLDDLEDRLDELKAQGRDLVREGEAIKERVMDTLEGKKEDIADSAVERIDSALAHLEELQHQGAETTAKVRKHFRNLPKKR